MARWFECPYLGGPVELTDEREAHIRFRHRDMEERLLELVTLTLSDPDAVHPSEIYSDRRLFSRWYDDLQGGKYVLVVVVQQDDPRRNWIATSHMLRNPVPGEALWRRS